MLIAWASQQWATAPVPPVDDEVRVTEDGDRRITETGDVRITEND